MTTTSSFTRIILFITILFCCCQNADNLKATKNSNTAISIADKEIAKKEIAGKINEIIQGCKQLNVDMALKPYSNSADFMIVNTDGSITNFQVMYKDQSAFFKSVKYLTFTTTKEDFKFLSKTLVLCTWEGHNEFELKTGGHMQTNPYVGSMLFSKTGSEWKIIYAHESSAQPVKVNMPK